MLSALHAAKMGGINHSSIEMGENIVQLLINRGQK